MPTRPLESPDLSEVESRFQELPQRYRSLKTACEGGVTSWRWASDNFYEPRPLYFERHGYKRGRLLRQVPKNPANKPEYGFGEEGLVHVARSHVRFEGYPNRLQFYETFYLHGDREIEAAHFHHHPDKWPIFYAVGNYDHGHLTLWQIRAQRGVSREAYSWKGDQLVRIDVEHTPVDDAGNHGPLVLWNQYEFQYDTKGAIEEILCHWPRRPDHPRDSTEVIYRRVSSDVSFKDLLSVMRSAVINAIIDRVRSAKIAYPVYSLALAWDPGQQESLPPMIGLGLDSERKKWIEGRGKEAKWLLWNPAEYQNFLEIRSTEVEEACRPINQECRLRGSWKEPARVLNDIARELGRMDWTGVLQTTDDFVAYATDLEQTDFRRNLKASARPELVKAFGQKGWLSP